MCLGFYERWGDLHGVIIQGVTIEGCGRGKKGKEKKGKGVKKEKRRREERVKRGGYTNMFKKKEKKDYTNMFKKKGKKGTIYMKYLDIKLFWCNFVRYKSFIIIAR